MNEFERRHVDVGDWVDIDVAYERSGPPASPEVSTRTVHRYAGQVYYVNSHSAAIRSDAWSFVTVEFDRCEIIFNEHKPYLENGWYRVNFSRENGSSFTGAYYCHDEKWYSDEERVYPANINSADVTFMDLMMVCYE